MLLSIITQSIIFMKQNSELIVLTLFLLLVVATTNYKTPVLLDYIGFAATAILVVAIAINLIGNWYKKR
ncbi:hypothetical protein HQK17_28175 [Bacillus cereus]|uniref:hypothetical protein n=1 Tax=Bacillus cereus TaxID=1396 RepID=UPI00156B9078|nr:hypothetical protein [Bacillus cereus]NRQ72000.1 hypothetical protein [Bacillus cereus]